jgi:hypothetical protein
MDFGKAFTYMFEDPDWLSKLGIGTLVVLLGIIFSPVLIGLIPLIIFMGYQLDVLRNVVDGQQYPLPRWEDWGGFLARGIKVVGAFIVWCLPLVLVAIPLAIGSALVESSDRPLGALGSMLIVCGSCLMILWGLFVTLLSPAIYVRLARTNRFSAAFEFSKIWAFTRDNIGNVIIAILLVWVAGLIASIFAVLGVIAIVIGLLITVPFATVWQYLVPAHLFGQIGAISAKRAA